MQIQLEIEENPNSWGVPLRVFSANTPPRPVSVVKLDVKQGLGIPHHVTGWSSANGGSPCQALVAEVEDSGAGVSYLVYGGDWGLRFKTLKDPSPWSSTDPSQFGEPCLLLADWSDIDPPL